MSQLPDKSLTYEQVAETIVEMGNRMLDEDESAEILEVASGMLAGAVQFWLYSRQQEPFNQVCADMSSAERRLQALLRETHNVAEESDYLVSPQDVLTGTA